MPISDSHGVRSNYVVASERSALFYVPINYITCGVSAISVIVCVVTVQPCKTLTV